MYPDETQDQDKKKPAGPTRESLETLKRLARDSAASNKARRREKGESEPPHAPEIDTSSLGSLLKSAKDRLSYAFFGPSDAKSEKKDDGKSKY